MTAVASTDSRGTERPRRTLFGWLPERASNTDLAWGLTLLVIVAAYALLYVNQLGAGLEFDEAYNLEVSRNLALGHGYATEGTMFGVDKKLFDPYITTGPTMLLPAGLLWWISGGALWAVRLVPLALFTGFLIVLYRIGAQVLGRWGGLVLAACPLLLHVGSRDLVTDSLVPGRMIGEFVGVGLLYICFWWLMRDRPLLAGLAAGLAVQTKSNLVLAGGILLLTWFVTTWIQRRRFPVRGLWAAAGAVLPTIAFEIYRLISFGGSITLWQASVTELQQFVDAQTTNVVDPWARLTPFAQLVSVGGYVLAAVAVLAAVHAVWRRARRHAAGSSTASTGRTDRQREHLMTALMLALAVGAVVLLATWIFQSKQDSVRQGLPTVLILVPLLGLAVLRELRHVRPLRVHGHSVRLLVPALAMAIGAFGAVQTVLVFLDPSAREMRTQQQAGVLALQRSGTPSLPINDWFHNPEMLILTGIPAQSRPGVGAPTVKVYTSLNALVVEGFPDARFMVHRCYGQILYAERDLLICRV
ncbi:ArnT family glycosyltransferase [Granulicoccus phenolivorans]|uniref:ArnT family glycosyltransferase n=1 Tax=Granulicoccus phenolivorans TaxID=266854 RepID=UPI0004244125|nr:hypothetical protein [Granulicoccus phenolivorans]